MYRYVVRLTPAREGGFLVAVPALPEIVTQGESRADALAAARDAIDEALANRLALDLDIPKSDVTARTTRFAEPSPYITLKVALRDAMRNAGVGKAKLARMLDVGETEVRRMLDPRHATKFRRLTAALEALGVTVRVEVQLPDSRRFAA